MTGQILDTPPVDARYRDMAPNVDWDSPIAEEPLFAMLDRAVETYPNHTYLDFLGRQWTYGDIAGLVDRAARGFQKMGVTKGVRVGLCLPNTPYYTICYFGALKAGATVVNFNPLYVEREIAYQVQDACVKIMVTLDLHQIYPKVAAQLDKTCLERIVVCPMRDILPPVKSVLFATLKRSEIADVPIDLQNCSFDQLIDNAGDYRPVDINAREDLAVLQYTGGTTGVPKGAMLTHANLSANADQLRRWFWQAEEGRESILAVLPFFHVFAMTVIQNLGTRLGAKLILLPRFELDSFLKAITKTRPSLLAAVPTIYGAVNGADLSKHDLGSLKYCISGGAPLPVEVRNRFQELTGCHLVEGYGLSEASPVTHCNPIGSPAPQKSGSIGIPVPGTEIFLRSLEHPDRNVPPGERGELCARGPQVMKGYWNRPDDTHQTLRGGVLHTGDVGTMDQDGFYFLVDRIKDVILAGGYNVYPRVIEEAIYLHPAVAEVVCIGIPDDYRGQKPKCFVRLRDDADPGVTGDSIRDFLRDKLSRIEMPSTIEVRDDLPKTMVGKLSKKELVDEELRLAGKNAP